MSKPRLTVTEETFGYQLTWFFPGDDDLGGCLGDEIYTEADLVKETDEDAREHIIATLAAGTSKGVERNPSRGYYWETRTAANAALKYANAMVKGAKSDKPWPEWAVKAKAAGWSPPKGWQP